MKSTITIFVILFILIFSACTKEEKIYITNTVIHKDTFIEKFFPCDSFIKWRSTTNWETNKMFDFYIPDSLNTNYELTKVYYGVKNTLSYNELPYTNIGKDYSIRYLLLPDNRFLLIAYGDTTAMNNNSDNMYGGVTLVCKKK